MNCAVCRGACCEELGLAAAPLLAAVCHGDSDFERWLELHGTRAPLPIGGELEVADGALRLECKCTALDELGRCGVYGERPDVCRQYEAGGRECLEVLERRRTAAERELIATTPLAVA
jgi:Fe-S-cluster containining protein